jgi:hypothetical protein
MRLLIVVLRLSSYFTFNKDAVLYAKQLPH